MSRKKTTVETTAAEEEILQAAETEAEAAEAEVPETGESTPENDGEEIMEQTVIYLGPTKKGIVSGVVLIGGYTETATKLIEAVPAAQLLFVPIPETAQAMAEIAEKGTARQIAYDQAWKAEL